ncbi:MAG: sensor histidine kinase [Beijerinckiaceae bacterium]|nr:sensor histidine kinase [Beijerinckiaceae bacterium]
MSMIREHRPIDLQVESDAFELNPHDAVSIGLVVTELVINVLKHAFPEGRAGSILVRYGTHEGKCILSVQDDGVGMPRHVAVRHVGLGSSIISALAKQMHAVVETSDSAPGTKVELVSRLPDQPSRIAQDARDLLVS